jgi:hypothetical protein
MHTLIAIAVTCWLSALVAIPRKPRPGNEVAELVYARLLGRQQRLVLLAILASALAFAIFVVHLPGTLPDDVAEVQRGQQGICASANAEPHVCWDERPSGIWTVERQQSDGSEKVDDYFPVHR